MDHLLIPVRPHVLKFLEYYLGPHYVLTEDDQFGSYLYMLLRRPTRDARLDHVLADNKAQWTVHFGALAPKKHGLRLTGKVVHKFNKFVDDILRTELCGYVNQAVRYGNKIKYAIEEYMSERDIRAEDLQLETLYKHYQRTSSERKARRKKAVILRPNRPEADVRRDLVRVPLPVPAARRAAA